MPTHYVVHAGDWRCLLAFAGTYVREKKSLGETRRVHKEPPARRRMHPISLNTRQAARERLPALPDTAILRPSVSRAI